MTVHECLDHIIALCENPHWQTERRWRIVELARRAKTELGPPKDYVVRAHNEHGGVVWLEGVIQDTSTWSANVNSAARWTKERARQLASQLKTSSEMLGFKLEAVKQ